MEESTVDPSGRRHADRSRAESFGRDAERYDRARPTYPAALFDALLGDRKRARESEPPTAVLDVGCGTGIAARQLTARGAHVLGVEADPRMAEVARGHGIDVEVSRFEAWDPGGRTFDLITAGQAWHWVEPVAGAAKAATVLRPGGRLALFWNFGRPSGELAGELEQVYKAVVPGLEPDSLGRGYARDPGHYETVDAIRNEARLTDPVREHFPWERTYTRADWLDQMPTHSDHSALDPSLLAKLLEGVGEVIDRHGGEFTMGFDTVLIRADRL